MINKIYYYILLLLFISIPIIFLTAYRFDLIEIIFQFQVSILAVSLIIIEAKQPIKKPKLRRYFYLSFFFLITIHPALSAVIEILMQKNTRPDGPIRDIGELLVYLSIFLVFLTPLFILGMFVSLFKMPFLENAIIKYSPLILAIIIGIYNAFYLAASG